MWCVLYTGDGNERRTEDFITHILPDRLCARCFHLTRNRLYKNNGIWHAVNEKFLPGYVFIDTHDPEGVFETLKKTPKRLLFSNGAHVGRLDADETALMERITDANGTVDISDVSIGEDGKVEYLSGPLAEVRERVRRVDLHHRFAEIETSFPYGKQTLWLGIRF